MRESIRTLFFSLACRVCAYILGPLCLFRVDHMLNVRDDLSVQILKNIDLLDLLPTGQVDEGAMSNTMVGPLIRQHHLIVILFELTLSFA